MKKSSVKTISIIVGICILAVILFFGMSYISKSKIQKSKSDEQLSDISELLDDADAFEKIEISEMTASYDEINEVYKGIDEEGNAVGFVAFVTASGYGGPFTVKVATDDSGKIIKHVRIGNNNETNGLGALIGEEKFYGQFNEMNTPVSLEGEKIVKQETDDKPMKDGVYKAEANDFYNGYKSFVEIEVKDGAIASVNWDAYGENGKNKKQASVDGEYIMTEDGLLWHEQAEKVEKLLVEFQDPAKFVLNDDGKTDAVTSVSISLSDFISLSQECINQAREAEYEEPTENVVSGVSGATTSSKAVVNAVNIAVKFISENLIV